MDVNHTIIERWKIAQALPKEYVHLLKPYLREKGWHNSTIEKLFSISPNCPTAQRILRQFGECYWTPYKSKNEDYPMWEYMVLFKLVMDKKLRVLVLKEDQRKAIKTRALLAFSLI